MIDLENSRIHVRPQPALARDTCPRLNPCVKNNQHLDRQPPSPRGWWLCFTMAWHRSQSDRNLTGLVGAQFPIVMTNIISVSAHDLSRLGYLDALQIFHWHGVDATIKTRWHGEVGKVGNVAKFPVRSSSSSWISRVLACLPLCGRLGQETSGSRLFSQSTRISILPGRNPPIGLICMIC